MASRRRVRPAQRGGVRPGTPPTGGTSGHSPGFGELDDVTLAAPVHVATLDRDLPVGSHGTVVGFWQDGRAYEVEFSEPFECLVTVPAEDLSR
jgi:hypothetical protein